MPKLLKQRQAHEGVSDWIRIYTESLHALSGRHKDAPVAKQARRVLDDLAREARSLGRGSIWLPEPGAEGYYPTIGEIAYPDVRTALRKGARSQVKEAAWTRARKTESPYIPPPQSTRDVPERGLGARSFGEKKTLRSQLTALGMIDENGKWLINPRGHTAEAAMARELMVAMPAAEGRYPEFLGRKVPGTLFRRERGSVLRWDEIAGDPGFHIGGGFSPMKFARVTSYARTRKRTPHETVNVIMPEPGFGSQAASSVIGGAAGASAALLVDRLVKALGRHVRKYALKSKEKACFYAGFFEQIKEAGLPALSRGALMGLLDAVHQELGILPAITVDNIPIHRKSFDSKFERLGNMELRARARRLAEHPLLRQEQDLLSQPGASKQALDAARIQSAPYRKTLEELMKEVIHREA